MRIAVRKIGNVATGDAAFRPTSPLRGETIPFHCLGALESAAAHDVELWRKMSTRLASDDVYRTSVFPLVLRRVAAAMLLLDSYSW